MITLAPCEKGAGVPAALTRREAAVSSRRGVGALHAVAVSRQDLPTIPTARARCHAPPPPPADVAQRYQHSVIIAAGNRVSAPRKERISVKALNPQPPPQSAIQKGAASAFVLRCSAPQRQRWPVAHTHGSAVFKACDQTSP